ncbi:M57 family metalloprotease [Niastella sp. OAS944]|uniref:M57 family metalloprotease n=1 Tax=Niastella sp. OAS944 TaxID=2664089 RepID=UPI0035C81898|nr:hypothetical protein [Chitinophagaceae bacterium OAS944]
MKNLFSLAILLAFGFVACKKSGSAEQNANQDDNAAKVLAYIRELGFPADQIVERDDAYVVEEDIVFPKNMQVPVEKVKPEQYYTGSLVTAAKVVNIRLKVDASMTSMQAEIDAAINQWNTVPNCKIHWTLVTGTSYDVLMVNSNLGSGVCGQGTFPSGGNAGGTIWINKNYIAGNSFAQRSRTICHEMGHNVSFRHTNWSARGESSATAVPGVGGTDASSIMNGGQCGSGATVLSTKDKQAAAVLYPL